MKRNWVIPLVIVFLSSFSFAQNEKEKKLSKQADGEFYVANYGKSIPLYAQLIEMNPNNFGYNYKMGISLFYSSKSSDKLKGVPYFETAMKNMGTDTMPEIYYYLGQTCQIAQRFDDAVKYYGLLKHYVTASQSAIKDELEIDNFIKQSKNGKEFIKTPVPVKITNLGSAINSEYPEYAPAISADESVLIYTSKRKETTGGQIEDEDGKYYEDIYISKKTTPTGNFPVASKIDKGDKRKHLIKSIFRPSGELYSTINTPDHDASLALSADGKNLYIYRTNDIWQTTLNDGKWDKPQILNENINSPSYQEPSVSQSPDGKFLYVVSNKAGGLGGKDIYRSTKQKDGNWGKLENLGPTINTPFDEDGPFIHPDGKTLFFSSQGHSGMGGFDIYKSVFENGKWSEPFNLGYPINTSADDIFFVINAKGDRAYYSSIKKDDNLGDLDIYVITPLDFPEMNKNLVASLGDPVFMSELPELNIKYVTSNNQLKTISILSQITENDKEIADVTLKVSNTKLNPDGNEYVVKSTTGEKMISYLIPGESYSLTLQKEGYPSHSLEFSIPENATTTYYQKIDFHDVKDSNGKIISEKTVVYNAFFNIDSAIAANPTYASMKKEEAYSALIKTIDEGNNKLNFKAFAFTDNYVEPVSAITANGNAADTTLALAVNNNKNKNPSEKKSRESDNSTTGGLAATKNKKNLPPDSGVETANDTGNKNMPSYSPILFDFAKSLLKTDAATELEKIYKYLSENKDISLEIYGHTDAKGTEQYNMNLSATRAQSVKAYFTNKGVSYKRVKAIGKGETQPIAPNENPDKTDNPEGRELNRRVEFKLVAVKK